MNNSAYTIKPFLPFRQLTIDGLEIAGRKHCIHGLIEMDVTQPRQYLRELKEKTRESLSFTGFIIYCCAKAVDANKHMHAYRDWRNRLILFDDIDLSAPVERRSDGRTEILQLIIRAANRKSVKEIHYEIRQAQTKEREDIALLRNARWYVKIPAFLRRSSYRILNRMPHLVKSTVER